MAIDDKSLLDKMVQDARIGGQRLYTDGNGPLTDEMKQAGRDRFRQYLDRAGKSDAQAARSMGLASSTLSAVLSDTYEADPDKILRQMDSWVEQQLMKESAPKPPGFVKIGLAEAIYGVVRWSIKTSSIVVIHGPTGCGKTTTLQAIAAETPGTVFYSIDSSSRTPRAVLEGLANALRMGGLKLSGAQLFRQIAAVLKGTGRLVIIDEVSKLAGRKNDDSLHMLRDLHDATGCPMVWAGNGKIASYIRDGHTEGFDPLDQIFGRISWWLDLTERAQGGGEDGTRLYTVEDIRRVFAASKLRLTSDAESYLMLMSNDPGLGCLRAAKFLVGMATVVARGQPITADMLKAIQRDRLSRRAADAIERQLEESRLKMAS